MEHNKAEKSNIAITNPDMSLLHFAQLPMSSFGMLSMSFAQQIMDRTDVSVKPVPMFTLDYLTEGEEAGPANVTVSPVLNLDFHFLLQELERLEKTRAEEKKAGEKKTEKKAEEKVVFVRQGDVYRLGNMSQEERSHLQIRKLTERCAALQESRLEKERKIHPQPKAVAKEEAGSSGGGALKTALTAGGEIVYTESYSMDRKFLHQFLEKQEEERRKQEELQRQQFDLPEAAGAGKKKGRSGRNGKKSKEVPAATEQRIHIGSEDGMGSGTENGRARFSDEELFDSIAAAERKNVHPENLLNAGATGPQPAEKQEESRTDGQPEEKAKTVLSGKPERSSVYLPEKKSAPRRRIAGSWEPAGKLLRKNPGMPQAEMLFTNVLQAEQRLGLTYGSEIGNENLFPKDRAAYLKATTEKIRRKEQLAEDLAALPSGILPPAELFFLKELSETPGLSEQLLRAAENEVKRAVEILTVKAEAGSVPGPDAAVPAADEALALSGWAAAGPFQKLESAVLTGGTAGPQSPGAIQKSGRTVLETIQKSGQTGPEAIQKAVGEKAALLPGQEEVLSPIELTDLEESGAAVQPGILQRTVPVAGEAAKPTEQPAILPHSEPAAGEHAGTEVLKGVLRQAGHTELIGGGKTNPASSPALNPASNLAAQAGYYGLQEELEYLNEVAVNGSAEEKAGLAAVLKAAGKAAAGPADTAADEVPVLSGRTVAELIRKLESGVLTGGTAGLQSPGAIQESGAAVQPGILPYSEPAAGEHTGTEVLKGVLQQAGHTELVSGGKANPASGPALNPALNPASNPASNPAAQAGYYGLQEELEYLNEVAVNGSAEEKAGLAAVLKAAGKAAADAADTAADEVPVLSGRTVAELIRKLESGVLTGGTAGLQSPGAIQESGRTVLKTIQKSGQTGSEAIQKAVGEKAALLPGQEEVLGPIELTDLEESGAAVQPGILQRTVPVAGKAAKPTEQPAILPHSESAAGEHTGTEVLRGVLQQAGHTELLGGGKTNPTSGPALNPALNPALKPALNPALNPASNPALNPASNPAAQAGYYGLQEELEYLNEAAVNGSAEEKADLAAVLKAAGKAAADAADTAADEAPVLSGRTVAERMVPMRGIRRETGEPENRKPQELPAAEKGFFADRPLDMSYVSAGADSSFDGFGTQQMPASGAEPKQTESAQSGYYRNLPEWTRNFLENSYRNPEESRQQSEKAAGMPPDSGEGRAIPAQTGISWSNPNIPSSYPERSSSEDIVLKNTREKEAQQIRITESEIRRTADKVYKILEERLRNERRRHGF